jgi:hypothetical protein
METLSPPVAQALARASDAFHALADFGDAVAALGAPGADPSCGALERLGDATLEAAKKALAELIRGAEATPRAEKIHRAFGEALPYAMAASDWGSVLATLGASQADPRPSAVGRIGWAIREAAARGELELDLARTGEEPAPRLIVPEAELV